MHECVVCSIRDAKRGINDIVYGVQVCQMNHSVINDIVYGIQVCQMNHAVTTCFKFSESWSKGHHGVQSKMQIACKSPYKMLIVCGTPFFTTMDHECSVLHSTDLKYILSVFTNVLAFRSKL